LRAGCDGLYLQCAVEIVILSETILTSRVKFANKVSRHYPPDLTFPFI
jgi:hypothetical protein